MPPPGRGFLRWHPDWFRHASRLPEDCSVSVAAGCLACGAAIISVASPSCTEFDLYDEFGYCWSPTRCARLAVLQRRCINSSRPSSPSRNQPTAPSTPSVKASQCAARRAIFGSPWAGRGLLRRCVFACSAADVAWTHAPSGAAGRLSVISIGPLNQVDQHTEGRFRCRRRRLLLAAPCAAEGCANQAASATDSGSAWVWRDAHLITRPYESIFLAALPLHRARTCRTSASSCGDWRGRHSSHAPFSRRGRRSHVTHRTSVTRRSELYAAGKMSANINTECLLRSRSRLSVPAPRTDAAAETRIRRATLVSAAQTFTVISRAQSRARFIDLFPRPAPLSTAVFPHPNPPARLSLDRKRHSATSAQTTLPGLPVSLHRCGHLPLYPGQRGRPERLSQVIGLAQPGRGSRRVRVIVFLCVAHFRAVVWRPAFSTTGELSSPWRATKLWDAYQLHQNPDRRLRGESTRGLARQAT